MGSAPSRGGAGGEDSPEARYLDRMETELLRGALPKGLEDEKAKKLKYELSWCLAKNDWYFTAGGVVLGGLLSYMSGTMKPFAGAVVAAPFLDWAYGRHVCAEYQEAYNEYRKQLMERYRAQAEELKAQVRGH